MESYEFSSAVECGMTGGTKKCDTAVLVGVRTLWLGCQVQGKVSSQCVNAPRPADLTQFKKKIQK